MNDNDPAFANDTSDHERLLMRVLDRSYSAFRLNHTADDGWAVVGDQSGAIAITAGDKMLIKLSKADAKRHASQMSELHFPSKGYALHSVVDAFR